jgi:glycosyltransferase involved in cell wall biosynthesis
MTPFLVFYRSWPWIVLHATTMPLIFFFHPGAQHSFWHQKTALFYLEYVPFIITGIWYCWRGIRHWPARFPAPRKISVIIPACNEERNIAACLTAVIDQSITGEIIVVDGGSTDSTVSISASFPSVITLSSPPGRGTQLARGVDHASGDCIIIVHADSRLSRDSLERCMSALQKYPDAAGGSFGAWYDHNGFRFRFTELLNNLRAKYTGISFGDQAQFFRKKILQDNFPSYKLMEDIEISFRLKEHGALLFIPRGVLSSTRMWRKNGFLKNFLTVLSLSTLYIIRRRWGLLSSDNADFYRRYYGKSL